MGVFFIENLAEVVAPSVDDHGTVRNDDCAVEVHLLDHLERCNCLSHTHFGVPKHFVSFLENTFGFLDGFELFGAEMYRRFVFAYLIRIKARLTVFDSLDGVFGGFEVAYKPFGGFAVDVKIFLFYSRPQ